MKAIRLHVRGSLESLRYEEVAEPHPRQGEVCIRVRATAVTPTELAWAPTSTTRTGEARPLPIVLGHEFSGEVAEVGPAVADVRVGDAVYGLNDWFSDGADAEYCIARATDLAAKPRSVDHAHAAAMPISGLTAWQGLFDRAQLTAGERVLIHGGAGGVGVCAVQLAHWRGAHVVTTVSDRNREFIRTLGADEVIDYRATRFEDVVHDVDVVFDTVGADILERSWAVLKAGGRLVTVAASGERVQRDAVRDAFFIVEPNAAQLGELARLIDEGHVHPVVDAVFPLARAREAYEHRTRRGKAVLAVS